MAAQRIGGSFAPPLTDELLEQYGQLNAAQPPGPVRDAVNALLVCCCRWWQLPDPAGTPTRPHPVGVGTIVDLHPDHAAALDPLIPWKHELDAIQALFDGIDPADKPLRDAAFHLLWHVRELDLGREPITCDRL